LKTRNLANGFIVFKARQYDIQFLKHTLFRSNCKVHLHENVVNFTERNNAHYDPTAFQKKLNYWL